MKQSFSNTSELPNCALCQIFFEGRCPEPPLLAQGCNIIVSLFISTYKNIISDFFWTKFMQVHYKAH